MKLITIDFETFYAKDYTLSKLTTEEYVNHTSYETIGVAVKVDDEPTQWFSGTEEETKQWLDSFDMHEHAVLAHNALFDCSILAFQYGIYPKVIFDTLSMGRALHGLTVGNSLDKLTQHYAVGTKGTEVHNFLGYRRADFTTEQMAAYAAYCVNDVELTYKLFKALVSRFQKAELHLIDMTIRMHTEPQFMADTAVLGAHLQDVRDRQAKLLSDLNITSADTRSDAKFAELLRAQGVEPPTKISPKTGREAYAFAKTDEALKELAEHPDVNVQMLVAARLGTKSTIEETRTERLMQAAPRNYGYLPIQLAYYGARSGRWAASGATNFQNIPRASPIKKGIVAPTGHLIVQADLSNIELRVGLWLAGQMDKLQLLKDGKDLYKDFACSVFGVAYEDVTVDQRFVGKTCIAEGTLVLCDSGWRPIEQVSTSDRVWDGETWVCHQGLVSKGYKETLSLCGSWLTPDHLVWSGTQWWESQSVASESCILSQALATGAANLPLQAIFRAPVGELLRLLSSAIVGVPSTLWTNTTSKILKALGAISVGLRQDKLKGIGRTLKLCPTMSIGAGYSTASLLQPIDAITQMMLGIKTTAHEAYQYMNRGDWTKPLSCSTSKRFRGGTSQNLKWTVSTLMGTICRAISDSYQELKIVRTDAKSASLRRKLPVYDLLCAGPRNRFTILTSSGPLIVHNCQLALIYGTSAGKLRAALKQGGADIPESEAKRIVDLYRSEYAKVAALWRGGQKVLECMRDDQSMMYGYNDVVAVHGGHGIILPSGMYLNYPGLRFVADHTNGKTEWHYDKTPKLQDRIYGAKVMQNLTQALARCVMGEAMVRINKKFRIGLTVHDALYLSVPEEQAPQVLDYVITEMTTPPEWLPGIVLGAEGSFGRTLKE